MRARFFALDGITSEFQALSTTCPLVSTSGPRFCHPLKGRGGKMLPFGWLQNQLDGSLRPIWVLENVEISDCGPKSHVRECPGGTSCQSAQWRHSWGRLFSTWVRLRVAKKRFLSGDSALYHETTVVTSPRQPGSFRGGESDILVICQRAPMASPVRMKSRL